MITVGGCIDIFGCYLQRPVLIIKNKCKKCDGRWLRIVGSINWNNVSEGGSEYREKYVTVELV